jgi:hypothetical protein
MGKINVSKKLPAWLSGQLTLLYSGREIDSTFIADLINGTAKAHKGNNEDKLIENIEVEFENLRDAIERGKRLIHIWKLWNKRREMTMTKTKINACPSCSMRV